MQKNPSLLTRFPYHIVFILFISLQSLHPQSHKLINWHSGLPLRDGVIDHINLALLPVSKGLVVLFLHCAKGLALVQPALEEISFNLALVCSVG